MAQVVHSSLNFFEFKELIKHQCKKLHPKGRDVMWVYGIREFINPKVHMASDYLNYCPALIHMT